MNKTKISWCDYTWNPVVGCKHGCKYCYAERINNRFKYIPKWSEPEFYPKRLIEPLDKKGVKIFVGSMCDLFGGWIPSVWIIRIIDICNYSPQHEFMFLTKNPIRYNEFDFPENCWIGATVEQLDIKGMERFEDIVEVKTSARKFLSIEPILGDFTDVDFDSFDLVIVGAMTGPGAIKPEKGWIDSIKHHNIHFKDNIKPFMQ